MLAEAGQLGDAVRVCFAALEEPPKADVLAHTEGDTIDRRFRVLLLDLGGVEVRAVASAIAQRLTPTERSGGQSQTIETATAEAKGHS